MKIWKDSRLSVRAGQLLTKIIEAIQLTRDQVYICNVVKCRPPNNRYPEPDEVAACSPFLLRQLESIRPTVICCLGAAAAQTILQTKVPIGRLRGRFHDCLGTKVMPTFHPSYLLRNPEAKRDVWEDMKKVRALLDQSAPGPRVIDSRLRPAPAEDEALKWLHNSTVEAPPSVGCRTCVFECLQRSEENIQFC